MTDKQIIIDGLDVSVCELYRNDNGVFAPDGTAERTELCYLTNDYCGNNPNCYYKQLLRKEQEVDVLKAERDKIKTICDNHFDEYEMGCLDLSDAIESLLERYDNAITGLMKQRKELKAENERLKQAFVESDNDCFRLEKENNLLKVYRSIAPFKVKMLVQTLDEIKEIVEIENNDIKVLYNSRTHQRMKQILQKISEVILNEN